MKIIQARLLDIDMVSHLFDLYRQFYGQCSDIENVQSFISARLMASDSVIFLALDEENIPMGFAQLYPSFSSVAMSKMWYLNDLYVVELHRNKGVARALLRKIKTMRRKRMH